MITPESHFIPETPSQPLTSIKTTETTRGAEPGGRVDEPVTRNGEYRTAIEKLGNKYGAYRYRIYRPGNAEPVAEGEAPDAISAATIAEAKVNELLRLGFESEAA